MDLSSLNFTSIAGLTAVGAVIATTWRHVANFGRYIVGFVIGTAIIKDDAGNAVSAFALKHAYRSPFAYRFFGGFESYVHPKHWIETVAYEGLGSDPVLIKHGRRFAIVSLANDDQVRMVGDYDSRGRMVKVMYLRWFFDVEQFTIDAVNYYNSQRRQLTPNGGQFKKPNRFRITRFSGGYRDYDSESKPGKDSPHAVEAPNSQRSIDQHIATGVYRLLNWKPEDLQQQPEAGQSPFTGYPFPDEVQTAIVELNLWLEQEEWFRSKSIPWRRGWLLHGPPGTGKSTLVRSLGMAFGLPVYVFDLSGMNNDNLCKAWEEMMNCTPCIALIEDIDNVYHGREYVGTKHLTGQNVSFDCLLNCISGVKQSDGIFLVITTNHIEHLDPAIGIPNSNGTSSRPGRIDKALYLGVMGEPQRLQLATHILSDFPELIADTVKAGEGETAAQFQARCADLALARFWKDKKVLVKDKPIKYVEAMHFNSGNPVNPNKIIASTAYGKLGNR